MIYHIHTDAQAALAETTARSLMSLGFWDSPFEPHQGHQHGDPGYEPVDHRTWKTSDPQAFRSLWRQTTATLIRSGFDGYAEAEALLFDDAFLEKAFNPTIAIPFSISRAELPPGGFRETELHVVFDRDRSHPALSGLLRQMGFHLGYIPKRGPDGPWMAEIRTLQGTKEQFRALTPVVRDFLRSAGGMVRGSLKEERIIHYWLSQPDVLRPPVVGSILWH